MKKRALSAVIAACIAAAALQTASVVDASASVVDPKLAQETVQGGAILHCYNWSFENIQAHLPEIAEAGYTAVQTSPIQPAKDYMEDQYEDGGWWKLYQPLDIRIADEGESWLGDSDDLASLCAEADAYDIKVIVDVVANHVANTSDGGTYDHVSPNVAQDLQNPEYYHSDPNGTSDDSRYNITQRHIGMPDLNTGNLYVQTKVLNFLKACVDCGVDGFRFDAAKHIELPNDEGCASEFWPTVINRIRNYTDDDLFIYGEILGSAGTNISNYTAYMDAVTDNETGNHARENAVNKNANGLHSGYYEKGTAADESVIWAESHDTYESDGTNLISDADIVKTWAIVGSRADSTSLFLARPATFMGDVGTDDTWKSTEVSEINKFKNVFDGQSEYLAYSDAYNATYNERGTKGVVISKLNGGGYVSLTANVMADGTYTDHVTNSTFTVSNGTITGTVGSSGIAVVYNDDDTQSTSSKYITADKLCLVPNSNWTQAGARFAMYFYNSYTNQNAWAGMSALDSSTYIGDVPSGEWTHVIFCRMNGSTTANSWDNKWNQTSDLTPPAGKNCYAVTDGTWDEGGGTWSFNSSAHQTATYGDPVWTWSSDYTSATAAFSCTLCTDHPTQTVTASGSDITVDNTHAGYTVYTASVEWNGTTYTDTKSRKLTAPEFIGDQVALSDEIGVDFYMNFPKGADVSQASAAFAWGDEETAEGTFTASSTYPGMYTTSVELPATCMTDTVTMTVTYGGSTVTRTFTVAQYAKDLAKLYPNNAKLKKLLCDMLNYGAAAQAQFDYNTDNSAYSAIADIDSTWTMDAAPASITDNSNITTSDLSDYGLAFQGATMTVTGKVASRLFFEVTDSDKFADTLAESDETALEFKDNEKGTLKYIEITASSPSEIFADNTIELVCPQQTTPFIYSAANYYNAVQRGNYDDSFKTVMKTMYVYSQSAASYAAG